MQMWVAALKSVAAYLCNFIEAFLISFFIIALFIGVVLGICWFLGRRS